MQRLSEVEVLVIETMVMRLTNKETLEYLERKNHKMSLANYYKIRKNLECNNDKRKFDFMNSGGLWSQHLERIDQLETALKLSWENYNNENDTFKKQKILESIVTIQPLLSKYYEASQYIIEHEAKQGGIRRHIQSSPQGSSSDEQFFVF